MESQFVSLYAVLCQHHHVSRSYRASWLITVKLPLSPSLTPSLPLSLSPSLPPSSLSPSLLPPSLLPLSLPPPSLSPSLSLSLSPSLPPSLSLGLLLSVIVFYGYNILVLNSFCTVITSLLLYRVIKRSAHLVMAQMVIEVSVSWS